MSDAPAKRKKQKRGRTKIACVPCQKGKRGCDGQLPCGRCSRMGKADQCVQMLDGAKKTKAKRAANTPEGVTDIVIPPEKQATMKTQFFAGVNLLRELPMDVLSSFGLKMDAGFIALDFNRSHDDVADGFLDSRVVSAGMPKPGFAKSMCEDPTLFVGSRIADLAPHPQQQMTREVTRTAITAPAPVPQQRFIRRYRLKKAIYDKTWKPVPVLLETTFFMDENSRPRWVFVTIAEELDEPLELEGEEKCGERKALLWSFDESFGLDAILAPPPEELVPSEEAIALSPDACTGDLKDWLDWEAGDDWFATNSSEFGPDSNAVQVNSFCYDVPL